MEIFFQVCFFVGIGYSLLVILGHIFGFINLDFDSDIEFDINPDGDFDLDLDVTGDIPMYNISPLKPIVIIPSLTAFGGIGWIGLKANWNIILIWLISLISGFVLGFLIYRFLIKPMFNAELRGLVLSHDTAIGKEAEVKVDIKPDRLGSIRYYIKDVLYNSSAKSINNEYIKNGEKVVIKSIEKGIMIVEKIDKQK